LSSARNACSLLGVSCSTRFGTPAMSSAWTARQISRPYLPPLPVPADKAVARSAMRNILDILYNFHWIVDQEAGRSSQAYAGFLARFLTRHRVQAVINLRGANPRFWWWRYEKSVCARLDVQHFDVRLNSRNLPPQRILLDLMECFDRAARPVLIKCSGGQDRATFCRSSSIFPTKSCPCPCLSRAKGYGSCGRKMLEYSCQAISLSGSVGRRDIVE